MNYFRDYRGISIDRYAKEELERVYINSSLMNENGKLTVLGALLFSKKPSQHYAGTGSVIAVIDGDDISDPLIETRQFVDTIFLNLHNSLSFINIHNKKTISAISPEGIREEKQEYPNKVIRELLINAFIHRDYSIEGSNIRVFIFKNYLEIRSPGLIPNFLTVEKMKMGVNFYRNPVLMSYFYDMGLIERLGRGIRLSFQEMKRHNNTEPEIVEQGNDVVVRIRK